MVLPSTVDGAPPRATSFGGLTSAEAASAAARRAVVLVPIGAVEQHGPHLPLGTDVWIAGAVATRAAERMSDVFVAEALPVGCSAHHRSFKGTVSLRVETFIAMIVDVASSLADDGFTVLFVNGHGGNRAPLAAALQTLLERGREAWGVTYFEPIRDDIEAAFPRDAIGHACALETSLSLALWPELVHTGLLPKAWQERNYPDASLFSSDSVVRHRHFAQIDSTGIVGDPGLSSLASGEMLFNRAAEELSKIIERIVAENIRARSKGSES